LAKLYELESCTQNLLGRHTALDAATIKGVVDRLTSRGLTHTWPDPTDARRFLVGLTPEGEQLIEEAIPRAAQITSRTLEPLGPDEQAIFLRLLKTLC
jgi:DNA-binding MarR family transcriptional regulator